MLQETVNAISNPTIDADWDKAAWEGGAVLALEHFMGDRPKHWPEVWAKVAYDGDSIHVIWRVEDNYVVARVTEHQQPVCLDSCVEWFFTPGGTHEANGYFNLETNCCGVMWLAWHPTEADEVKLPVNDLARIEVAASLPGPIIDEIAEPTVWTLECHLPLAVLEKYAAVVQPQPGVTWRANFYKCADECSHPHWLTWSPVDWPEPAFHMPGQFGTLEFA